MAGHFLNERSTISAVDRELFYVITYSLVSSQYRGIFPGKPTDSENSHLLRSTAGDTNAWITYLQISNRLHGTLIVHRDTFHLNAGNMPARPPLWSSGQISWLQNEDVLCFLSSTNWIYICYVEESWLPLWSSGPESIHGATRFSEKYWV
jgi:hypothetical protein